MSLGEVVTMYRYFWITLKVNLFRKQPWRCTLIGKKPKTCKARQFFDRIVMRRSLDYATLTTVFFGLCVALTDTSSCDFEQQKSATVKVRLDPASELWTSPGTYRTVELHLSLDQDLEDNSTRRVLISHFEKFPSRGRHATFVTSMRPNSLELSPWDSQKVSITIFAPDYIPNGSRVQISLVVQERPRHSRGHAASAGMNIRDIILGHRTFYFAVTNSPLGIIDPDPPKCQSKFLCSTINEQCLSQEDCELYEWSSEVLIQDGITGLRGVVSQEAIITDDDLIIGSVDNVTVQVSGSCCDQVVDLNITDVAGNWRICRASINASGKVACSFLVLVLMSFVILTLIWP